MKIFFHRTELFIECVLERSAGMLSRQSLSVFRILANLIRTVEENAKPDSLGHWIAPHVFQITLGNQIGKALPPTSELNRQLASKLDDYFRQRDLLLRGPLSISIQADANIPAHAVRISAEIPDDENRTTDSFLPTANDSIDLPPDAFFIVNGGRHVPLDTPSVGIGRHLENQLVLDDPMVSRRHALLRARNGRFLLTDLGSKHGTRVNNLTVMECILCTGDVLRIGQTELIYSDEYQEERTQPLSMEPITLPSAASGMGKTG